MYVVRGLRQAFLLICASVAVAVAVASLWWALQDGGSG
jgi:nitrogen fixation-related uncharacterized protein